MRSAVDQVVSDVKLAQQDALTTHSLTGVEFEIGGRTYMLINGGKIARLSSVGGSLKFEGKDHFSFASSGYTDVGGSGTLVINGRSGQKKLIVSSRGRIRVE